MPTKLFPNSTTVPLSVLNDFLKLSLHQKYTVIEVCGLSKRESKESHLSYFQRVLKDISKMNLVNSLIDEIGIESKYQGRS